MLTGLIFGTVLLVSGLVAHDYNDHCSHTIPIPDYYWRPYYGVIPDDAIKGGNDGYNVTYIGQIPAQKIAGEIPAIIHPGKAAAEGVFDKSFWHGDSVKILCAPKRENFEWIKTSVDDMHLLTDYDFIVGGYEYVSNKLLKLYIGRIKYDNKLIVGKVFGSETHLKGIRIPAPDGTQVLYKSFELLVHPK